MKALILVWLLVPALALAQTDTTMHTHTYLALGDSYTIGESLPLPQSFPYQVVQMLRKKGVPIHAPEIIAKTGWTTDELTSAMRDHQFEAKYDFVTLLIGVNNQYRGREVIPFKEELENLIVRAIELANGKKDHVLLLTIPNYGITPFAASLDREKITRELEVYNSVIKALAIQYKVSLVDSGPDFNAAKDHAELLATDDLHPSAQAYEQWAQRVAAQVFSLLK
jgi:lysophospholipase L1-like esterase